MVIVIVMIMTTTTTLKTTTRGLVVYGRRVSVAYCFDLAARDGLVITFTWS